MAEAKQALSRRLPLDAEPVSADALAIRLLVPRARFSLRLDPSQLSTAKAGLRLYIGHAVNRRMSSGERVAMRLGPDEWLLSGAEGEAARIAGDVGAALAGLHHSLVDVGHRHVAFSVAGVRAADVINSGCPLDLSLPAFPAGFATRTLLGEAEVILAKTDDLPVFEVECGRSFAPTFAISFWKRPASSAPTTRAIVRG
jgi:sarcosine oxidase subunit gamma